MDNRLFKQLPQSHNLFCKALFGKELDNRAPVWRDTCPYKALSNYNFSKVYCVFMFMQKAQTFGKPTLLGITAQFFILIDF